MFAPGNIAGEIETRRKLSVFANNLVALLGLLVLGFPVTPATIRTTVASWALVAIATMQFGLRYLRPLVIEADNKQSFRGEI